MFAEKIHRSVVSTFNTVEDRKYFNIDMGWVKYTNGLLDDSLATNQISHRKITTMDFGKLSPVNNPASPQYSKNLQKDSKMIDDNSTFSQIYNSCFVNGVGLAESTSIHILRAVTTMKSSRSDYRKITTMLDVEKSGHTDKLSKMLHEQFPFGFFSHDLFIGFKHLVSHDSAPTVVFRDLYGSGARRLVEITYLTGSVWDEFFPVLEAFIYKPPISVELIKSIDDNGQTHSEMVAFSPEKLYLPNIEFYPFIKQSYKNVPEKELTVDWIVEDFMNSKNNLLLLIGPPGTGKSTFIRSFIREVNENLMINNGRVLEHPSLPNTFRSKPETDGKRMLTIYEDADGFVRPRDEDNSGLSAMLNHLDGCVGSEEKFIISTNLESLAKIDKALKRPGRCHKIIKFRKLTGGEINEARQSVGLAEIETKKPLTLSEALHYENEDIDDRKAVFGFTPDVN